MNYSCTIRIILFVTKCDRNRYKRIAISRYKKRDVNFYTIFFFIIQRDIKFWQRASAFVI